MCYHGHNGTMKYAVAYTRVSTDEQASSGLGLQAQRDAITGAAKALGLTITHWATDNGVSGGAPLDKRPGLIDALGRIEKNTTLLVAKQDRLARDMYLYLWLEKEVAKAGGVIVSAAGEGNGDSPSDVLMRHIVAAFAEYERAIIRARTKAAKSVARTRGKVPGGNVPYGYDVGEGGRLVPNPHEQAGIRSILRWRASGKSWDEIRQMLTERGWSSKSGGTWTKTTVKRIWKRHCAVRTADAA